jgi:ketosteroid isomerase-like protein
MTQLKYGGRRLALAFVLLGGILNAADTEEKAVLAAVRTLFDGMSAKDAAMIKSAMTPDAKLIGARTGRPASVVARDDFAAGIAANKGQLLERIWNPKVMVRGEIAMVWADYDFHSNGKFHHCGVDTMLMLKTAEGWKATALSYTSETEGCAPSPLGPPK